MSINLNPARFEEEVFNKLLLGVVRASGLVGDIAEFGSLAGGGKTAQLLAFAIAQVERNGMPQYGNHRKSLHLFSSFSGHPPITEAPDRDCPQVVAGAWEAGHYAGPSPSDLAAHCATSLERARVEIFAGGFKDTIASLPPDTRYAMVHIDCELYASTRDVLSGLLERGMIAEGAMILFDDWDCNRASPRFGERRAWSECVETFAVDFSDGGSYGLLSHCFILHGYRGLRAAG